MSTLVFLLTLVTILMLNLCRAVSISTGIGNLDPKCPPAALSGFETNIFQFDVPAERFYNKIGSFFHSEWYTGPLNFTHGKDNTVGSTRSGTYAGQFYTERLVAYSRSSSELTLRFTLQNPPVTLEGVKFTSYTEEMRVMSICGGSATYISMTVVYCTDHFVKAYALYDRIRRVAIGAVADQLNALVFAGTCPIGRSQ